MARGKKQEEAAAEAAASTLKRAPQEEEASAEAGASTLKRAPQYILSADVRWQRLGLFALVNLMRGAGLPAEKLRELERVEREFELWEEV